MTALTQTSGTFVALQSVPGLIIMYAGLSKAKWSINSAFMGLYAFSMTLVVWVLFAFNSELSKDTTNSVSFGPEWFPLCGIPTPVLGIGTQLSQSRIPAEGAAQSISLSSLV
jgi:Amt family ammonium transporter